MQGRLEHKMINEKNIDTMLKDLPECVTAYYLSRSSSKESKGMVEYIRKLRNFFQFIRPDEKDIDITSITEMDVVRYLKSIETTTDAAGKERETSFAYRKQVHAILNSFFTYLIKKMIIVEHPMVCIDRPSAIDNVKRMQLDEFDLKSILNAVESGAGTERQKNRQERWKERDRAILVLLMNTGMRATALSEINIEDIDFAHNTITIIDKKHKTHIYVINNVMREALVAWMDKRQEKLGDIPLDALFISNQRTRLDEATISYTVRKYAREGIGYNISPHKLRAAFCTILYNRTNDIEKVRAAVGHTCVSTTQIYIVNGNTAREESADIMDSVLR